MGIAITKSSIVVFRKLFNIYKLIHRPCVLLWIKWIATPEKRNAGCAIPTARDETRNVEMSLTEIVKHNDALGWPASHRDGGGVVGVVRRRDGGARWSRLIKRRGKTNEQLLSVTTCGIDTHQLQEVYKLDEAIWRRPNESANSEKD